jgi:hypothetical protein
VRLAGVPEGKLTGGALRYNAMEVLSTISLLKDSYVQSKESNLSFRERELEVQEKKFEIEKKRVEMEIQDRAAARDVKTSTMLAMVSLVKSLSEKLEK